MSSLLLAEEADRPAVRVLRLPDLADDQVMTKDETWEWIQSIVNEVSVKPYSIQLIRREGYAHNPDTILLQACLWRMDTDTGAWGWGYGGLQFIPEDATEDAIIKRCFVAARDYSEHEVREAFTYKGRRVFDPHQSIASLWEISRDV